MFLRDGLTSIADLVVRRVHGLCLEKPVFRLYRLRWWSGVAELLLLGLALLLAQQANPFL